MLSLRLMVNLLLVVWAMLLVLGLGVWYVLVVCLCVCGTESLTDRGLCVSGLTMLLGIRC